MACPKGGGIYSALARGFRKGIGRQRGLARESVCSDSVKRHLRGRHLSALNLKFDFISDGGCTREEQIALSLKRHLFPHGGREPKAFWICFSRVHPPSEIKSNFQNTKAAFAKAAFDTLRYARDAGLFSAPFSYAPLGEGGHSAGGTIWAVFGALLVANPFPQTPSPNL